jgi:hypothetical protein
MAGRRTLAAVALLAIAASAGGAADAATVVYSSAGELAAALGASVLDDYEDTDYETQQTDIQMTAALGETAYTATGTPDGNLVIALTKLDHYYCAGCGGTFRLDFTSTSVSTANGVFGVGFDLLSSSGVSAFVTFGDGSTADYDLPFASAFGPRAYFGLASDLGIRTIHVAAHDQATTDGVFVAIDNLRIGAAAAVPEPSVWSMMILGFGGLGWALRRRFIVTSNPSASRG